MAPLTHGLTQAVEGSTVSGYWNAYSLEPSTLPF